MPSPSAWSPLSWLTVALVFPSLYLISRTRAGTAARLAGAGIALVAATGWVVGRLGLLANPLAGAEHAVISHPWVVVGGLAAVAVCCWPAVHRSAATPAAIPAPTRLGG